jgi:hypothetical protein
MMVPKGARVSQLFASNHDDAGLLPRMLVTERCTAPWCQLAFRGPGICGIDTEEDASESDLTPRTISNCLRHLEIKPSKRSLIFNSFIKPSIVAGSPISINL